MDTMTLHVSAGGGYDILIEHGVLDRAGALIKATLPKARRLFVVTDTNVSPLYGPRLVASLEIESFEVHTFVLPAGETSKNASNLVALWEWMTAHGVTRTDGVVALGGGVVGDLAGFAASTVLRGVGLVQIPTTLLSQVDSSVGGKTAIDLATGKNLAGTFTQPRLVLMDPETLHTLPDREFAAGMAEVVKYGCIWDAAFFDFLKARPSREALMADIGRVLHTCCDIKRQVVETDEHDTGLRMILNFGHTLGHAYELAGGYARWIHGEAVAAGMVTAAKLGVALGVTDPDVPGQIEAILSPLGLPVAIDCDFSDLEKAVGIDKKSAGDDVTLILLVKIGAVRPLKLPKAEVLDVLAGMRGR